MKDKYYFIGFILILAFAALALSGGKSPFSIFGSDFTINSISTSRVISNEADLAGTWFIVDSTLGGGQTITGEATQAAILSQTGYQAKNKIDVAASAQSEWVDYKIINERNGIYKYSILKAPTCPADTIYSIPRNFLIWTIDNICFVKTKYGVSGVFDNPSTNYAATLTVTIAGKSLKQTISNSQIAADFKDGNNILATAQWTGSLVTGNSPPNQNNYIPFFYSSTFGQNPSWHVAKASDYDTYKSDEIATDKQLQLYATHPNDFQCSSEADCMRILNNAITSVNSRANTILNSNYKLSSYDTLVNPNTEDSAAVRVYIDRQLNSPQIVWRIRADWLGVIINVAQPQILSVASDTFGSGEQGRIDVVVKNPAAQTATFVGTFTGCDPFMMDGSAPKVSIAGGQQATISLFVSHGTLNVDTTKTCTVRVYDFNSPSRYAEKAVSVSMTKAKVCTPGKYEMQGDCIYQCNIYGTDTIQKTCCDGKGVSYDPNHPGSYGGFFCSITGENGCNTDSDCNDNNDQTIDKCEASLLGLGQKECKHYSANTCWVDSDCNDDKFWTVDKCADAMQLIGKRGNCTHDLDIILLIGIIIAILIVLLTMFFVL